MKEEREGRWERSILERKNKETERRKTSAQSLEKIFPELRNESYQNEGPH